MIGPRPPATGPRPVGPRPVGGRRRRTPSPFAHIASPFEGFRRSAAAGASESLTQQFNEKIEGMDAGEMKRYICETFDGIKAVDASGDTFFMYDPDGDLPTERQFPFVTIVTGDHYDTVSKLNKPGAYRLNIGLTKATYAAMFGAAPTRRDADGVLDTRFDHTTVDTVVPHPIYATQHWVCVVNPGEATLENVRTLLAEAHRFAVRKYANHQARREHRPEEVN